MKKIFAVASVVALAACAEAEAPSPEEEAPVEEMAQSAVVPGNYEITWPDGTVSSTTIGEDGTFTGVNAEGEEGSGTVADVDGKACFDFPDDDQDALCWTAGEPGEDGSFTSTADDGTVVSVRPVVEEAAAE